MKPNTVINLFNPPTKKRFKQTFDFDASEIQEDQRKQEQESFKVEEPIQENQGARSPYREGRLA